MARGGGGRGGTLGGGTGLERGSRGGDGGGGGGEGGREGTVLQLVYSTNGVTHVTVQYAWHVDLELARRAQEKLTSAFPRRTPVRYL